MERDSLIFYRSFYEAIVDLPKDIKLEVFTAIVEYGLYGRLPENPKPVAKGIFTLVKPNIDANTARFENGKKGGRKKRVKELPETESEEYSMTYEQEVELMRSNKEWKTAICSDFNISAEEYDSRLIRFLRHCNDEKTRKGKERHNSWSDAQSHLRYWMTKAYSKQQSTNQSAQDIISLPFPEAGNDFGGADYDETNRYE